MKYDWGWLGLFFAGLVWVAVALARNDYNENLAAYLVAGLLMQLLGWWLGSRLQKRLSDREGDD